MNRWWKKQEQPPSGMLLWLPSWLIVSYSYFDSLVNYWLPPLPPLAATTTATYLQLIVTSQPQLIVLLFSILVLSHSRALASTTTMSSSPSQQPLADCFPFFIFSNFHRELASTTTSCGHLHSHLWLIVFLFCLWHPPLAFAAIHICSTPIAFGLNAHCLPLLLHPPFASGAQHSHPPDMTNAHHLPLVPTTCYWQVVPTTCFFSHLCPLPTIHLCHLWCALLGSSTHHLLLLPATGLLYPPFFSGTQHLQLPVASSAHHFPLVPNICLW